MEERRARGSADAEYETELRALVDKAAIASAAKGTCNTCNAVWK